MTARELMAYMQRCGPQELNVVFHFLADQAGQARLSNGARLCDVSDFSAWLRELGDAARISGEIPDSTEVLPMPERSTRPRVTERPAQLRNWNACPRCGHVHEGDRECGVEIGRGQICRCEMEVPV
ncbi:MAG TPA: hypothetical protein VFF58_00500 [Candidatus Nitrosotalea sp.]|nr:hypothetical protein [Candidatus Nitrosotalea sp.]